MSLILASKLKCIILFKLLMFLIFLGFFVDLNLFKANKEKAAEIAKNNNANNVNGNSGTSGQEGLANEDANLMIKLKFLTYKVHMLVCALVA